MNKQDMENLDSNEKYDHDLISTEMLEYIRDGSQTHPNVNRIEHVIKNVIVLSKDNWNGKERYKLREAWVKVYTRYFRLL